MFEPVNKNILFSQGLEFPRSLQIWNHRKVDLPSPADSKFFSLRDCLQKTTTHLPNMDELMRDGLSEFIRWLIDLEEDDDDVLIVEGNSTVLLFSLLEGYDSKFEARVPKTKMINAKV